MQGKGTKCFWKHHFMPIFCLILWWIGKEDDVVPIECYWEYQLQLIPIFCLILFIGKEDDVYRALQKLPHSQVFRKEDIPRELFFTYNRRIAPILIMMEEGYWPCCINGSSASHLNSKWSQVSIWINVDQKITECGSLIMCFSCLFSLKYLTMF